LRKSSPNAMMPDMWKPRLRVLFATITSLGVAIAPGRAPAQTSSSSAEADYGGAEGSFQPPVNVLDNNGTHLFGAGFTVGADVLRLYGATVGISHGLGRAPKPKLAYETGAILVSGSGDLNGGMSAAMGGSKLGLGITQAMGFYTLKLRAVDPGDRGWAGLVLYAGGNAGMFQMSMTNTLGTAYRHSLSVGADAGIVAQFFWRPWVDVVVFGGGRALALASFPETGDKEPMPSTSMLSPVIGGNITAHLPYSLDVSLQSLFNTFKRDDKKNTAKVYMLSLAWHLGGDVPATVSAADPAAPPGTGGGAPTAAPAAEQPIEGGTL